jgi:asparagine synthase (glutamine-hydrolysing)
MSGIVGIFRPDGGPVDAGLVRALTRFLAFRGPDAGDVWHTSSVALGHAMLRTTEESALGRQPAGLDDRFWITADARLDARGELIEALTKTGRDPLRDAPDSDLILHSYAAWGEGCLERLRGDFAFGIWDAPRKSLFCARDHFGIKPFYFAEHKDFFLFSNTLDCVRLHPDVPDDLNEMAIADFLLFGLNCDPATTTFRAIRRLPPAHFLRVSADGLRIGRYWSIPVDGHVRYKHADQYVEHFQALLREAVADRLRGGHTAIMLSGGLDSSSCAATARELSPVKGEAGKLRAFTVTYEQILSEQDGAHAREVAEFLDIPIRCLPMDALRPFQGWDDPDVRWPEPVEDPLGMGLFKQFKAVATECRVALDCEGPDNLMIFQMWPYIRSLAKERDWSRLATDVIRFLRVRRVPWRGMRQRALSLAGTGRAFPGWIAPDFARRVNARERWRQGWAAREGPRHPVMPKAHASMSLPHWTKLFELQNPGVTHRLVEVRYPFLDLRIVSFLLGIPPFPWAYEKTVLRAAMAGRLPERVRRRPKTPLRGDPLRAAVRKHGFSEVSEANWTTETETYTTSPPKVLKMADREIEDLESHRLPLCLNFWLRHARTVGYKLMAEVGNA